MKLSKPKTESMDFLEKTDIYCTVQGKYCINEIGHKLYLTLNNRCRANGLCIGMNSLDVLKVINNGSWGILEKESKK